MAGDIEELLHLAILLEERAQSECQNLQSEGIRLSQEVAQLREAYRDGLQVDWDDPVRETTGQNDVWLGFLVKRQSALNTSLAKNRAAEMQAKDGLKTQFAKRQAIEALALEEVELQNEKDKTKSRKRISAIAAVSRFRRP